jgi:hypothetical protein
VASCTFSRRPDEPNANGILEKPKNKLSNFTASKRFLFPLLPALCSPALKAIRYSFYNEKVYTE